LGGAQQWRIEASVTGVDQSKSMTHFAMTGSMGNPESFKYVEKGFDSKVGAMLFILVGLGTIGQIRGLDEALKVDSVIGSCISHKEGDLVLDYGTSDHVLAYIHLVSDDKQKIKRDMLKIQSLVQVEDIQGQNMLLPQFDVDQL
jgi:hypothetical protein